MIWTMLALIFLGVVAWIAVGAMKIGAVSEGDLIGERSGTALLMIDLQTVFWDADMFTETAKADAEAQILADVYAAKSKGIPVIAIRQEWSIPSTKAVAKLLMKGQAVEGTQGIELASPFAGVSEHELIKRVQDAFETKELDRVLKQLDVGKIIIVGLDTNYCVAKTALAARRRRYEVEICERCILSANPKNAEKTLDMLRRKGVVLR